jgi:chromosome partitioning protein
MTTIALLSGGGSTAKSSTAVTLATMLAQEGNIVRIIDLDYQQSTSKMLQASWRVPTVGDVLTGRPNSTINAASTPTDVDGLLVVPANKSLNHDEIDLTGRLARDPSVPLRLRHALDAAEPADVTIIDCQGDVGLLAVMGLLAADKVIAVVLPTAKSLDGLPRIRDMIQDARKHPECSHLELAAVIPCKVRRGNSGAIYAETLEDMRAAFGDLVSPPVRESAQVADAERMNTPFPIYAPAAGAMDDYRAVRAFLADRGVV